MDNMSNDILFKHFSIIIFDLKLIILYLKNNSLIILNIKML
jgi:hypothetical protein